MIRPIWLKEGDSFFHRHVGLAELAEEACDKAITAVLSAWLKEVEQKDGPAAKEAA